jgi:phospholipid/cholesterol/gamma-HCH transport system substrate-binding protein
MKTLVGEHLTEALIGLLVILVAAGFAVFAWNRTQQGAGNGGYAVTARFPNVTGVAVGTDVRLAGMRVGTVTDAKLDPKNFQAILTLDITPELKLPVDSSAAITSEGLLGGSFIALAPGGETDVLRAGDEITDTQGATDLLGLVGSFINKSGSSGDTAGDSAGNAAGAGSKGATAAK